MTLAHAPQLVFSTRATQPRSGTDFDRRIVAESRDVATAVRGDFSRRADLVGTVARADLHRPVYTFSRVDAEGERPWLFARTVSIGRYRGGHQLLTHGLLLDRWHLEAMEGNPFLLEPADGEPSPFLQEHPGTDRELPVLRLRLPPAAASRDENLRRLARLSGELSGRDGDFPALLDGLTADGPVAYVLERPDPRLAEWLLLHLHPDDRTETSFHTFYCHGRAVPYRLLLVAPPDERSVRGQFRPLRLVAEGEEGGSPLGERARELRRLSPAALERTLRRYRVTFLASREYPPLSREDAELCLRSGLDVPLSAEETKRLLRLRRRAGDEDRLADAVLELAGGWPAERVRYPDRAAELADSLRPPTPLEVRRAVEKLQGGPPPHRWATLVLLAADTRRGALATPRARSHAWAAVAAEGGDREILDFLAASPGGDPDPTALPILGRYLVDAAERLPAGSAASLAVLVSALLDAEPTGSRHLQASPRAASTLLSATAEAIAVRIREGRELLSPDRLERWLEAICPHVPQAATPGAGRLLAMCATAGAEELVRTTVEHLRGASWAGGEPFPAALGEAASFLHPELERSPGGARALPLLQGFAVLLAEAGAASRDEPRSKATDAAFAAACLPALVLLQDLESRVRAGILPEASLPPLRDAWLRWLGEVFVQGRTVEVLSDSRWLDLLEDDLRHSPSQSAGPEDVGEGLPDHRRRVLLRLAWSSWSEAAPASEDSHADVREGRLLRLGLSGASAHHQVIEEVVPDERRPAAFSLLLETRESGTVPTQYGRDA